ncbi:MAG: Ig-like protein, partial [Ignavibacteria bacterium]|nr:Ig-like protein [Ignavibacteria bacterium]
VLPTLTLNGYTGAITWHQYKDGGPYSNATDYNSSTFGGHALNATDYITPATYTIWAEVTSGVCSTALSSNTVTILVNPPIYPPSVTTVMDPPYTPICEGVGTIELDVSAFNVNTYQWKVSTNGTTWNNLSNGGYYSGVSTASLTITQPSATIDGYEYRCQMLPLSGCSETVYSSSATVTVDPTSVGGSVSQSATTITTYGSATFTLGSNLGGVTWMESTDGGNSFFTVGYSPTSYEPMYILNNPNTPAEHRIFASSQSGVCNSANSNTVTIWVNPASFGGYASLMPTNGYACNGDSPTFTLTAESGTFIWQKSTDDVTFSNVNGSQNNHAFSESLTVGTYYYRAAVTYYPDNTEYSNSLTVTVSETPGGTIASTDVNVCYLNSAILTLSSHTGAINWQYYFDGNWVDVFYYYNGMTSLELPSSYQTETKMYRALLSNPGCTDVATTNTATITVHPLPTPSITGNPNVCVNQMGSTFGISNPVSGNTYLWSVSSGGTISGSNSNTSVSINWSSLSGQETVNVLETTAAGCTATPVDPYMVTVHELPVIYVTPEAFVQCGPSDAATFTAEANEPGMTFVWYNYDWMQVYAGNPFMTTITGPYYCVGTSTYGCSNTFGSQVIVYPNEPLTSNTITSISGVSTDVFTIDYSNTSGVTGYIISIAQNDGFTGAVSTTITDLSATSHQFTGLTKNTTYYVRMLGYDNCGNFSAYSNTVSQRTLNPTITVTGTSFDFGNVPAMTNSTATFFTVSGSELYPGAPIVLTAPTFFTISQGATYGSSLTLPSTNGSVSSSTIWVRFEPTMYGMQSGNISLTSTSATTQMVALTGMGYITQNAITSLNGVSTDVMTANYTLVTGGHTHYRIQRATDENFTSPTTATITNLSATSYQFTGLSKNTTYYVRMAAFDASGNQGAWSSTVSQRTLNPTITVTGGPFDFGNVPAATSSSASSFTVNGSELFAGASIDLAAPTYFTISLTESSGFGSSLMLSSSSGIFGSSVGTTPIWTRFDPTGYGTQSGNISLSSTSATNQTVAVTGMGYITQNSITSITNISTDVMTANYTLVTGGHTKYQIERATNANFTSSTTFTISDISTTLTSYQLTGLSKNTTYYVRMAAFDASGNQGLWSTTISQRTLNPTLVLSASSLTYGQTENGLVSTSQNFTVSGTELHTASISLSTGSSSFSLSTNNSSFGPSVTLSSPASSNYGYDFSAATIYARFEPHGLGTLTGTMTASSTSATDQTISLSGLAIAARPTVQAHDVAFYYDAAGTVSFSFTNGNAVDGRLVVLGVGTTLENADIGTTFPTDGTYYTSPSTDWNSNTNTLSDLVYGTAKVVGFGSATNYTITNVPTSEDVWVRVFEYNGSTTTTSFLRSTATLNPNQVKYLTFSTIGNQANTSMSSAVVTVQSFTISSVDRAGAAVYAPSAGVACTIDKYGTGISTTSTLSAGTTHSITSGNQTVPVATLAITSTTFGSYDNPMALRVSATDYFSGYSTTFGVQPTEPSVGATNVILTATGTGTVTYKRQYSGAESATAPNRVKTLILINNNGTCADPTDGKWYKDETYSSSAQTIAFNSSTTQTKLSDNSTVAVGVVSASYTQGNIVFCTVSNMTSNFCNGVLYLNGKLINFYGAKTGSLATGQSGSDYHAVNYKTTGVTKNDYRASVTCKESKNGIDAELIAFNANSTNRHVNTDWATRTEIGVIGYELYRAEMNDGLKEYNFSRVASYLSNASLVASNSQSGGNYKYVDNDPTLKLGKTYLYKLVFVGIDGQEYDLDAQFVTILSMSNSSSNMYVSELMPNPASEELNFTLELATEEQVNIEVFDIAGNSIDIPVDGIVYKPGITNFKIKLNDRYASGTYIMQVSAGNEFIMQKFSVVK